ncbi:MAG TPA: response regulator [Pirellulales bacterium]|nr:response regulator [Pirellulales bacterium]
MASVSLQPRVLIVEDHPDTADLLGRYARLLNCETRIAHTGKEASAEAAEFLPQIILLDIGLPDTDGWELATALREKLEPVHPVMIAITCYNSPEDRRRSEQAGIDHHLAKPAFRGDLMRLLMKLVGQN